MFKFKNKKDRELSLKLDTCLYDIDCLLDDIEDLQETQDKIMEIAEKLLEQSNKLCQMVDKMNAKDKGIANLQQGATTESLDKNDGRTLEEIVNNIDKLMADKKEKYDN